MVVKTGNRKMIKKNIFKTKNDLAQIERKVDEWVLGSSTTGSISTNPIVNNSLTNEETRFTIVIPTYMHRRIKKYCASKGISIKIKLFEILKKEFPEA